MSESMVLERQPLYQSDKQEIIGDVCGPCRDGGRSIYDSSRFATALLTLTNAGGVLSLAAASQFTMFNQGRGETGTEAGYPAGFLLTDAQTNVPKGNGLQLWRTTSVGVQIGNPIYQTSATTVLTANPAPELASYRDMIASFVGEHAVVNVVRCIDDNETVYTLGTLGRLPCARGRNDLNFPGSHAMPGVPQLLGGVFDVGAASGNKRLISVRLNIAAAATFNATATPATANVFVPVRIELEGAPFVGG